MLVFVLVFSLDEGSGVWETYLEDRAADIDQKRGLRVCSERRIEVSLTRKMSCSETVVSRRGGEYSVMKNGKI